MADTTWPVQLPEVVLADVAAHDAAEAAIRTPMEFGPAKLRKRTATNPDEVPIAFIVESDDLAQLFIDFYKANAARTFTGLKIPLRSDGTKTLAFKTPARVVLVDKPNIWRCACTVEVRHS